MRGGGREKGSEGGRDKERARERRRERESVLREKEKQTNGGTHDLDPSTFLLKRYIYCDKGKVSVVSHNKCCLIYVN